MEILKYLINIKNEFMGLSKISKMVVGIILIFLLIFLFLPSTKYYEGDNVDVQDDLLTYNSEIIKNGTVVGGLDGYLWRVFFGVPKDPLETPITVELDVKDGKIISLRMFSEKGEDKVKIETVSGEKYFRYSSLEGEFKNGYLYHYFIDGTIQSKSEGYFKGGSYFHNGKYYEYDEKGEIKEEDELKDVRWITFIK